MNEGKLIYEITQSEKKVHNLTRDNAELKKENESLSRMLKHHEAYRNLDVIINQVRNTCDEMIIITNKKTIDSLWRSIESSDATIGEFSNKVNKKVKSVCKAGFSVHLVDENDITAKII